MAILCLKRALVIESIILSVHQGNLLLFSSHDVYLLFIMRHYFELIFSLVQDFADTMMETKKRSLDYCMFPGFRHGELVELPAQLEAPPLLHKITKIQKFNVISSI